MTKKLIWLEVRDQITNEKLLDELVEFKFLDKKDLQNKIINYAKKKCNFSKHIHKLEAVFYD